MATASLSACRLIRQSHPLHAFHPAGLVARRASMSAPDGPESGLNDKVSAWLDSQGYPLEFLTANAFHRRDFGVLQGYYVPDVQSGTPREIDVLASATHADVESLLRITYVVECKYSRDKPWVVFTSPRGNMHPAACIAQTVGSATGAAILWTLAGDKQLQSLDTFRAPPRPGFGHQRYFSRMRIIIGKCSLNPSTLGYLPRPKRTGFCTRRYQPSRGTSPPQRIPGLL